MWHVASGPRNVEPFARGGQDVGGEISRASFEELLPMMGLEACPTIALFTALHFGFLP